MANLFKHGPRMAKRDVYGNSVTKYIVVDERGFNIGEFDTKVDAFVCLTKNPASKIFKFMIYELIK